jgi:peptidyl-prolyl cis-trans isomerase A (cyclophilin A)
VIDKIAALPTRALGPFAGDVPNPLVLIESAHVIGEETPAPAASTEAPATAASAPTRPAAAKPGGKVAKPASKG